MAKKNRSKKKSLVIMYIILGLSIAGVLTFGVWLGVEHYLDSQSQNFYTSILADTEFRPRNPSGRAMANAPENTAGEDTHNSGGAQKENQWVAFADFDELSNRFPGIIGWIRLEGTPIDYPIMQGTDNDFFLSHLADGTRHRSGSIFMDFRNASDFSDRNTILYGHMLRSEDMFGVLKHFRVQEFYDANYTMYIHTAERDYQLVIFAVHLVNPAVEQPLITFADDEEFINYLMQTKDRSLISSDIVVGVDDKIVTLATCAYDFNNARLVVVGKLIPF